MIRVLVIGKVTYEKKQNVMLAARAFGASCITFTSVDAKTEKGLKQYCKRTNDEWGGAFQVGFMNDWKAFLAEKKKEYKTVYLTRYGIGIRKKEYAIRTYKNILLILSAKENIKELYTAADFNISITNQPHTIVSAMVSFLNVYYGGRELALHFENAKYKVIPEEHGVHVEKK